MNPKNPISALYDFLEDLCLILADDRTAPEARPAIERLRDRIQEVYDKRVSEYQQLIQLAPRDFRVHVEDGVDWVVANSHVKEGSRTRFVSRDHVRSKQFFNIASNDISVQNGLFRYFKRQFQTQFQGDNHLIDIDIFGSLIVAKDQSGNMLTATMADVLLQTILKEVEKNG